MRNSGSKETLFSRIPVGGGGGGGFHSSDRFFDLLSFFLPIGMVFELHVVGRLFLTEVVLLCLMPLLLLDLEAIFQDTLVRWLLLLAAVWLGFQVVTDILRSTPFEDYSRGWSRVVFLVVNFLTIFWLVAYREKRIWLISVGYIAAALVAEIFKPPDFGEFNWKFFWGFPVTIFFTLVAAYAKRPSTKSAILLVVAVLNFSQHDRTKGAICTLLGLLFIWESLFGSGIKSQALSRRSRIVLPVILAMTALVILPLYTATAGRGFFGAEEQEKSTFQISLGEQYIGHGVLGEYFAMLIGGRTEIMVSSRAIMDSPFFGHGSWAKDSSYLDLLGAEAGRDIDNNREYMANLYDDSLIPTHSHIFGSWVDSGIGGALFWIALFFVFYEALIRTLTFTGKLASLLLFFFGLELWDIVFSPFGAERRFATAFFLVCACYIFKRTKHSEPLPGGLWLGPVDHAEPPDNLIFPTHEKGR
jgi:hypothetical protein